MITAEINNFVAHLSDTERGELLDVLLESIDPADANDPDPDGIIEAERRLAEMDSGEVAGISREELMAGVQADRVRR